MNNKEQITNRGATTKDEIILKLTTNGTSHFYSPLPAGFPPGPGGGPAHFHAISGGHLPQQQQQQQQAPQQPTPPQQQPHSPSPPNSYHKDERSQRQHTKLLRKLEKQREFNSAMSTPAHSPSPRRSELNGHHNHNNNSQSAATIQTLTTTTATLLTSNSNSHNHHLNNPQHHHQHQPQLQQNNHQSHTRRNGAIAQIPIQQLSVGGGGGASSVGTSEDGEDAASSVAEDEEDYQATIVEQLSAIQKPEVTDITSRSAKIVWEVPSIADPLLINIRDLRYNVLLSDRAKDCKYKSLYKGESFDCIVQDLLPGQEYVVRLQVHYEKLQGSASEPTEFTTPPCEPDQPIPPKLVMRTKNSLHLRWINPLANGAPIQHYLLEYDEGKSTILPSLTRTPRHQHQQQQQQQMHFVEVVKTKGKHYILTKLQPSTVYNFRLAALNEVGSSLYSPICTFSTSGNPPTAPKSPTLQAISASSIRLVWERRHQDADFVLQMLDRESGHGFLNMYNGPDCSYECIQLRRATAYQFRLRSENDAGTSSWSNEVTYKTAPERPGRPGKPHVKGKIHGHHFKARWDAPTDTGGAEILRYFLEITSGSKFERIYAGSETETTCDRLQPGTTYQLRASCEGPAGLSSYSEVAHITSEAIVPAAPPPPYYDNLPGPYAAVLRLDKPEYNGGAPVLEFELQLRQPTDDESSEAAQPTIVYRGKDAFSVIKDLQPGRSYEVQLRALNRIGAGAWSPWFHFTTAAAPPYSPAAPKVVVKSATHVLVSWQEPAGNGAPIAEYRLESATISNSNDETAETTTPTSNEFHTCYQGLQTSADLRNLLPFTLYYFRVNASNVAGVSKWSSLVNAKTPAAVPSAPQIKDYEFTANKVSLSWTQPECNGSPITAYTIEYSDRSLTTLDAVTEYTIFDLMPETSYKFRVQAVNAVGVGPFSAYAKLTTLPSPPVPPTLECTGVGHNFIKLKWGDGRNLDFTKFYVEMYVQRAKDFQVVYSGTNCMCKVNKLQERTAYTFRICAGNDRAGDGDYSEEYIFSTTATLPNSIKAPRVAFDGGVCGGTTNNSGFIPTGLLLETPTRFINGLGNLSLGVPLTLEWQHSKNTFNDRVEYVLQYAIGKDGDFKQIYRGPETKFTIENLEPGSTYQFRVCPIRVANAGDADLPGTYTSAFRYQVPQFPSLDDIIDGSLLSSAANVFGHTSNNNNNGSGGNAHIGGCYVHSHHSHHSHGIHPHNNHAHNHHAHHNTLNQQASTLLHQRSVSASALSRNSSGGGTLLLANNAIGIISIDSMPSEVAANLASCDDPNHHHHHHHFHAVSTIGGDMDIVPNNPAAGSLLATNTLISSNVTHHAQNVGALRRFATKLTAVYTNRKRFSDQEKAVIFMVSFLFFTFLFATLVKMFMR